MTKKLTAYLLLLSLLLSFAPAAPAEENAAPASGRVYYSPDKVYTITEDGELLPGGGGETLLDAPLDSAFSLDQAQPFTLTGLDENDVTSFDAHGGLGGLPGEDPDARPGAVKQLTYEDIQAMNPDSQVIAVFSNNGYLSMLLGKYYDQPVRDQEDGIRSVQGLASLLGFSKGSEFFTVYASRNNTGYTFYTYQQRYGRYTLRYATLRIIVDPEGYTAGLSCSFTPNAGMATHEPKITGEEALEIVREKYAGVDLKYYPERTARQAAFFYNRLFDCYVVYTSNPDVTVSFDMPYLEHFVTVLGEYTYGIPTDTFAADPDNVMDNSAYFRGLQTRDYTRTMTLEDGSTRTVTVPVSYNPNDGQYYLIDPERRIAVARYDDFNYHDKVTFVTSPTVDGWDQNNLLAYANYRIMYDFYADHGIRSVDGFETPILITVGWCDENGEAVDNACFYGVNRGWACFGISYANHYGDALDVVGHEYTHGVVRQSMQGSLGINETGAIGEAYSDIMGNLAEMSLNYTDDRSWKVAERTGRYIRDMGRPNDREQPEFVGDRYYKSPVNEPVTGINDCGGVHNDDSLLGHIAYLMDQTGMTYEQQIALWLTAIEIITPLSDYTDLHGALLLSLKINGMLDEYGPALNRAFAASGLDDDWTESYLTAQRPGCGRVIFEPLEGLGDLACAVYFLTPDGDTVDRAYPDPKHRVSALLPAGTYIARLLLRTDNGGSEIYNYTGTGWNTTGTLLAFSVKDGAVTRLTYSETPKAKEYGDVKLKDYDGGYFSMKVPEGWTVEVGGEYTSFCFKISDPDDPSSQVFLYGNLVPFHKSELARSYWAKQNAAVGAAPVLVSHDILGVLNCWNYTVSFMDAVGFSPAYTPLDDMDLLGGSYFKSSFYSGLADSESACVITCDTPWEEGCRLTVAGTLVDFDKKGAYGGNMYYNLINLYGIMAPEARYDKVFDTLQECAKSLKFTDAYLREAKKHGENMANNANRTRYLKYLADVMKDCYETYGR